MQTMPAGGAGSGHLPRLRAGRCGRARGGGTGTLKARIALFQASLAKRLPKNPNVHLADFGAVEASHPEWFQVDGLHLNGAGRAAYASYVADQVATTC